ncbi:MAG: MazF family toxin-antitoxin system [Limosilactobacillus sp.]|jgi:mRNA interferase MazF|uniref:MazF family toxin-antitoxin system n=1 Tax=Limosilactobacillus sp. TaxID=2773925 RepID=UPI0025C71813|nr:MazF family toxin-antitoxin system [Limosilactobacillus sp.]MCI1975081.1 MazF family toxin-antitoxin system [Limosilactobacillus sp.]MCI2031024.1 MazF family toxin-antitoxin system [Limosilactobacillus sp.]
MKTNDISIAFVSWPGGGKRRPIYIISDENNKVRFYKITSKYDNKSPKIKKYYFKINQWSDAGLNRQSYIDTITVGKIDKSKFKLEVIGKLTKQDAERLVVFLSSQN